MHRPQQIRGGRISISGFASRDPHLTSPASQLWSLPKQQHSNSNKISTRSFKEGYLEPWKEHESCPERFKDQLWLCLALWPWANDPVSLSSDIWCIALFSSRHFEASDAFGVHLFYIFILKPDFILKSGQWKEDGRERRKKSWYKEMSPRNIVQGTSWQSSG